MRILHIFDASNYIYIGNAKKQSAIRGVRECDGEYIPNRAPIGGVTFLASKIIPILENGEDIFIAFDRKPIYKMEMYRKVFGYEREYKGQRKKDNGVFKQKDFAEQLVNLAGVPCGFADEFEADDVIYSIWKKYYDSYDYIRIHSEDSDLAFMVDNKTEIIPVKSNGRHITVSNYHYTVHTNQLTPYNMALLLKVILGDSSDHISGTGDAKEWLSAFADVVEKHGFEMQKMGDIQYCREFIIKVVTEHPELKNAHNALNIFNLVTPVLINTENFDEPGCQGDIKMLKAITGLVQKRLDYPVIEDYLSEYISEFNS